MSLNEKTQTHYAISKIEDMKKGVAQIINELPLSRSKLNTVSDNKNKAREVYADLQKQRDKLVELINSATLALVEMDETELANYSSKLASSVKTFNIMTPDYGKFCSAINVYLSKLPKFNATTNASIIGRLMNSVKMGYYPTDLEHIKQIANGINFPEGITANVFDPCCGCGLALQTLAQYHNCNTYGIELDSCRADEALTRLDRVGFGSYFHSRISHEAFHLMLLNPPYLNVITESGSNTRLEKRFLVDTIHHLTYGGLLIYIIPYYRLTADICRVLCDNFTDLTVWKFVGDEFKRFKQVAIMGVRQKRCDGSAFVAELASLSLTPDNILELSEFPNDRYQLPVVSKKVELFKGAQFNVAELSEQLSRSTSFTKLFVKNRLDNIKRPLLPLNIGQIGLVGGSGLINGLVNCNTPHLLKGRIIKNNNAAREENHNSRGEVTSTTLVETRSNKMVFNLLTPSGFLSLSDYSKMSDY